MIQQGLILGMMYPCLNGSWVTMVRVHNPGTHYETMEDEYGRNRYSSKTRPSDIGRCTSSPPEHPFNLNMDYVQSLYTGP